MTNESKLREAAQAAYEFLSRGGPIADKDYCVVTELAAALALPITAPGAEVVSDAEIADLAESLRDEKGYDRHESEAWVKDCADAMRLALARFGAQPAAATHRQGLQVAEGDMLAARALAKSYRENPREAGLADQATMRLAAQDPLRKFSQSPAPLPEAQPVSDNGAVAYPPFPTPNGDIDGRCRAWDCVRMCEFADATVALRFALSASQAHGKSEAAAYPEITDDDRRLLHDNPNTDDIIVWVRAFADATVALRAQRSPAAPVAAVPINDERSKFEAAFEKPEAVTWQGEAEGYTVQEGYENSYRCNSFIAQWSAWRVRAALAAAAPASVPGAPNYERMFNAACVDLGLINEALDLDPDDGGAEPILAAIADLKALAAPVSQAGAQESQPPVAWMRAGSGGYFEFDQCQASDACAFPVYRAAPVPKAPDAEKDAALADHIWVPVYVVDALKAWTGSGPSVSVLARAVDRWTDPAAEWEHDAALQAEAQKTGGAA